LAVALVIAASSAIAPGAALAGSRHTASTQADRAALHAYVLDMYVYAEAVTEVAPAMVATYERTASRIADECPDVLAGAPQDTEIVAAPSIPSRTARQRGEEKRRSTQLSDLETELDLALDSAEQEPRRPAARTLLANLKALPQGDPVLSQVVRADTIGLEEDLQVENTSVCADMEAWVGSGYRTLSPASRALALKREAALTGFLRDLAALSANEAMSATETPADKALVHKTSQLELQTAETVANSIDSARRRVEVALGLTTHANREKRLKPISHESKSSTEIGAIRTAAGTRFTVWLERKKGGSADACKLSVELRGADGAKPGLLELLDGESGVCFSPRRDRSEEPNIKCNEGLLKIEAEVPSATRAVDLRMSNGTQIVSRPVLVPRRLGGPDAFYYQAVRGPTPIPVSLTERDAHGRILRVVNLRRIVGCSKHPMEYLSGGKRTLVRGHAPQGPGFSIVGERYRLFGRIHTQLKLKIGEGLLGSGEGEEEEPNEGRSGSFAVPIKHTTPLDSEVSAGCHPHEYSIFYGLLKQPGDAVLAKVAGKLVPVLRVGIPASLHAEGVLVYLASSGRPEEVVVRSPSGKLVMSDDLSRAASEERETCEGESEGSGPPPGDDFSETGETSRIVLETDASG
jgi:hypothetical protein